MKLISSPIALKDMREMAKAGFGNMVKAVVDLKKEIMAVDADMHADEEAVLLENGSQQEDLWGINLYPDIDGEDFIEFDSMINVRPSQGNLSRSVDSAHIRQQIVAVVNKLVIK